MGHLLASGILGYCTLDVDSWNYYGLENEVTGLRTRIPQVEIKTDIFMKIPRHCSIHKSNWKENILKLKKNLYSLCNAGRTWNEHITQGLLNRGFKQSEVDPCLFIKEKMILVLYVDDAVVILPDKL